MFIFICNNIKGDCPFFFVSNCHQQNTQGQRDYCFAPSRLRKLAWTASSMQLRTLFKPQNHLCPEKFSLQWSVLDSHYTSWYEVNNNSYILNTFNTITLFNWPFILSHGSLMVIFFYCFLLEIFLRSSKKGSYGEGSI